jgi:hypothetical protein
MTTMTQRKQAWAPLNRGTGESAESWMRRNREEHRARWRTTKIAEGNWIPAEEYERLTGRPGKVLHDHEELWARTNRERVAGSARERRSAGRGNAGSSSSLGRELSSAGKGALASAGRSASATAVSAIARGDRDAAAIAWDAAKAGAVAVARSAAVRVTEVGIERALTHAASRSAAVVLKEAAKGATKQAGKRLAIESGKQALKSAARANAVGAAAGFLVDQGADTIRLAAGKIGAREYGRRSVENAGGAGGGLGGAAAGAAIGTAILPGAGTVVGGILGGILGGLGGSWLSGKIVR